MKKILISAFLGFWGGIGGALIFEPIDGFLDILLSDYTIGGILVGVLTGLLGNKSPKLFKNLLVSVGIGLIVFLIFSFFSKHYTTDLIAGGVIGLLVGLVTHFYSRKKSSTSNQA